MLTGAFGLLGSSLANYITRRLKKEGIFVYGLDDGLVNPYDNLDLGTYTYSYSYDRIDAGRVFSIRKFDVVIHFAGYKVLNEGLPDSDLEYFLYENNVAKTAKLVSVCEKYGSKLIFASTLDLEDSVFRRSKLMSELDIMSRKNLDWCIVRFGHLYGDRQRIFEGDFNILGNWMRAFLEKKPLPILGDGSSTVIVNYVEDFLAPLCNIFLNNSVWGKEVDLGLNVLSANRLCRSFIAALQFYKDWDSDAVIEDYPVEYFPEKDYLFKRSTKNSRAIGCEDFSGDSLRIKYNLHDFVEKFRKRWQKR